MKVNTLTLKSSQFPIRLSSLTDSPEQLYVLGNTNLLNAEHALSVVGSRKITPYGRQITTDLVEDVAKHGVIIVSGLALGVDALAHQACLNVNGKTIAVMPCGLDNIYPASHRNLALKILENDGLLVSEYSQGVCPLKHHFIARNRIVSGLGDAILVTEASRQSGTIHTANFALEQGRTVMAVPGNITSPESQGTNNLIRNGALPVTEVQDIFEVLEINTEKESVEVFASNDQEQTVLELLKSGVSDGDELLAGSRLDVSSFNQTLTMLEITGKIKALGNNQWSVR